MRLLARLAAYGHREDCLKICQQLENLADRLYFGSLDLQRWWQEIHSVRRRMKIARGRHLFQTDVSILSVAESAGYERHLEDTLIHARKLGIRKPLTILPGVTLLDLHLVAENVHPDLFREDLTMVVRSS